VLLAVLVEDLIADAVVRSTSSCFRSCALVS